ncbi:MAG: glycosyltransferase family 2 protein [Herpetosiphonaceae bacterium]|nr:glycosyltransferase family 2 protein [Herpetosiphonaceae bacterium]
MSTHPLVSLIVVTYNSAAELASFFAALAGTTYPRYEVIVVDNASTDTTVADLAAYPATPIASSTNLGFGRGCNRGAAAAQGEYLVFLNPDVQVTPEWLSVLMQHSQQHPEAMLCPSTLYPDQPPPPPVPPLEVVAAVPGCALFVPRATWQQVGPFDEHIFLYWEDTELCWRASLLGYRIMADFVSIVYHQRGASTGFRRWDDELTKNSLYTYLKLMRWRRVLPFTLVLAVKTLLKLAIYRQPGLGRAWWWNIRHLPQTLRARRLVLDKRQTAPIIIERLIAEHARRMRRERRARRGD